VLCLKAPLEHFTPSHNRLLVKCCAVPATKARSSSRGVFLLCSCSHGIIMEPLSCATQVLLSCNILGNPIGVFTSLGTGVRDFFKHPAEGAVVSPADFALGVGEWRSPFVVPLLCPCCARAVPVRCPCCAPAVTL
jgi:hypothetical protein